MSSTASVAATLSPKTRQKIAIEAGLLAFLMANLARFLTAAPHVNQHVPCGPQIARDINSS